MKILYFASTSYGGLLNYAQEQANALAKAGAEVDVLCSRNFRKQPGDAYNLLPLCIERRPETKAGRLGRVISFLYVICHNRRVLRREIVRGGYKHVLIGSYAEYFAPLWARSFRKLARRGVEFGVVVHEPVRDFQLGPKGWHDRSVKSAYSFVKYAFTHDEGRIDSADTIPGLRRIVIPHGPQRFPDAAESRSETRKRLNIPEDAVVLLSFGHIRDNKNLDFSIRALASVPEAFLLVAGKRNAASQKPEEHYVRLAEELGVAARCRWIFDYVSDAEAANLFGASDLVMLTYRSSFHSASGVMNLAARYRKEVVASAGEGSLKSVCQKHQLGVWVEPDKPEAVVEELRKWISRRGSAGEGRAGKDRGPDWEGYEAENSWRRNAEIVCQAFSGEFDRKRLLYYAPTSYGGLGNYAQEQADALAGLGIQVDVLCSPDFVKRPGDRFNVLPRLIDGRPMKEMGRVFKAGRFCAILLANFATLRREIVRGGYDKVFLVSYAEYFAPLWAWMFAGLRHRGIVFGAVVQEPVRNFQVGPTWWHRWSISCAYGFLSHAFEHDDVALDTVRPRPDLRVHIVPMGPQKFPDPAASREETRRRLGIPPEAVVVFSFGHIRDNKNLDFAVRALREVPEAWLLVAGKRTSESQKSESYYVELAKSLGVDDRCTWIFEYVSETEAANLFEACDLVLLTYSSSFFSASGVLNVAAKYRKPCIASAGEGSLKKVVREYRLGVWVEPDKAEAVAQGIKLWLACAPKPDWEGYAASNSWQRNAEIVQDALFSD